jgi:arsenate reductase
MERVLFVCVHNSARSQMAEAFVNSFCNASLRAESAGFEPGSLNPLAVEAMREVGIDISGASTKSVFSLFKSGSLYNYVITVCDEASAESCPIFPGVVTRLHWSFADPSTFEGTWDERLEGTRTVRDQIRTAVQRWCGEVSKTPSELCGVTVR